MEKPPSFERVIGATTEAEKAEIRQEREERFDDQVFEELEGNERDKTPEELGLIARINDATNHIRERYGLPLIDVPPANIHVIKEEDWPENKGSAFLNQELQAIVLRDQPAKIVLAEKVFHEMLHFKSYRAIQITVGDEPELMDYRLGLTVKTRDGKNLYFRSLNEAVTEELTKRFILANSRHPFFAQEFHQTKTVRHQYQGETTASGEPLFSDETFYAASKRTPKWHDAIGRLLGRKQRVALVSENFTYGRARGTLRTLVAKLFEHNPGRFRTQEEVFDVFAKAMMTGNLVPLGRLIERTFGRGTFRRIGELDGDTDAQEKLMDALGCDLD